MRKFFYIRVSIKNQSIERQIVTAAEISIPEEYFFIDRASRKDIKHPEYQLLKRMLRNGDVLYIQSLDRLGRNKQITLDE
nr:Transposon Tn3 resolvase [Bacillus cereus]